MRIAVAGILFVLMTSLSTGQGPKNVAAKPDPVEALQAEALKNSPDIKIAQAKVKLAQAKLEKAQADLKAKVAIAHAEVEAARAGAAEGAERYERAVKLYSLRPPAIAKEDLDAAALSHGRLRAELAIKEAQLKALIRTPAKKK